ncbi:MAG TPA: iron ABC transporter, partial [Flavobacterium sp.]|nr:iron ABC transporter [Flavobacterium sp.]
MFQKRNTILFTFLLLLLVVSLLLNISFGQVAIPIKEVFKSLLGSPASKETWEYII